jgi:hypothetical protein
MVNYNNMLMLANLDLTGWPLAVVICVGAICIATVFIGRWPWQKR